MYIPEKLSLADIPTPITKLERLSRELDCNLYLKHDEMTGFEYSGNKIRKLEYALKQALDQGCDTLITTGGIQSNHCRATVAAGIKLGLKSVVLLRVRNKGELKMEGNYFLDKVMGADVRFCTAEEYSNSRDRIMESIARDLAGKGRKAYIIPEGASNGIGCFGYFNCMQEIIRQEEETGLRFDTIAFATGSGGTAAGLNLYNILHKSGKRIVSYCVCDDAPYFSRRIAGLCNDCLRIMQIPDQVPVDEGQIEVHDKFVGIGYALSRKEELDFISRIARLEGIIFDPVYTGKALYGLTTEIARGQYKKSKNILFIHTGGLFGIFPKQDEFVF